MEVRFFKNGKMESSTTLFNLKEKRSFTNPIELLKEEKEIIVEDLKNDLCEKMVNNIRETFHKNNVVVTQDMVDKMTPLLELNIIEKTDFKFVYIDEAGDEISVEEMNKLINDGIVVMYNNKLYDAEDLVELDFTVEIRTYTYMEGEMSFKESVLDIHLEGDEVE